MARGAPPAFLKKSAGKGKPNPFASKRAPPFGSKTAPSVETPSPPAFRRGGKVRGK